MTLRIASCLLLFFCLAACDQPEQAEQARAPAVPALSTSETPPPAEPQPATAAQPAPVPAKKPAPIQPATVTGKPATVLSRKMPEEQQVTARQPPFEVDLHLPQELLDALEPYEPLELEPLLPAFFGREPESGVRLNGRLIESPTEERMFDGAELKIEIRR